MANSQDFIKYNKKILAGEDVTDFKFSGEVKGLPDNYKEWVENNQERIAKAQSVPYFLKDNADIINKANPKAGIGDYYKTKESKRKAVEAYEKRGNLTKAKLTEEQQRNLNAIAEKLEVEVREPMDFWGANEKRGNINYGKRLSYDENCVSCVMAHELRRKGLDVSALGKIDPGDNALLNDLLNHPRKMYKNAGFKTIGKGGSATERELEVATKKVGRYQLSWDVKGANFGHTITAERLAGGELVLYDPQSSTLWGKGFLDSVDEKGIEIVKVDNLCLNKEFINMWVDEKNKVAELTKKKAKHRKR